MSEFDINMKYVTKQMIEDLVFGPHSSSLSPDRLTNFWWQYRIEKSKVLAPEKKQENEPDAP